MTVARTIKTMYRDGELSKEEARTAYFLVSMSGEDSLESLDQCLKTMGLDGSIVYDYCEI